MVQHNSLFDSIKYVAKTLINKRNIGKIGSRPPHSQRRPRHFFDVLSVDFAYQLFTNFSIKQCPSDPQKQQSISISKLTKHFKAQRSLSKEINNYFSTYSKTLLVKVKLKSFRKMAVFQLRSEIEAETKLAEGNTII